MEAIKCPNCGSEKVKELTEEKPLQELIDGGCDYIIAASYGYGPDVK